MNRWLPYALVALAAQVLCAGSLMGCGNQRRFAAAEEPECSGCHGSSDNPAPPKSLSAAPEAAKRGIGAHQEHLRDSAWHAAILCGDCHQVPQAVSDPGHLDTQLPAEVVFSERARTKGAEPTWDETSCSGTYCHGATLSGGKHASPVWTQVDGSQVQCDGCHGMPPGGDHPTESQCVMCHIGVVDADNAIVAPERHIDGIVEASATHTEGWEAGAEHGPPFMAQPETCTGCHGASLEGGSGPSCAGAGCHEATWQTDCTYCHGGGDNQTGAPPRGVDGALLPSAPGVGQHTSHLSDSGTHLAFACGTCHPIPPEALSPGHLGPPPADVQFAGLAAGGSYDAGTRTCSIYCHGDGQNGEGTATWTSSLAGQCSACHDDETGGEKMGLSGFHAKHIIDKNVSCNGCHYAFNCEQSSGKQVDPAKHVDGRVDVCVPSWQPVAKTCAPSCHEPKGWYEDDD